MPIERLFKRAHTGLDTVNRAIQGHRDRSKARWDSLDKRSGLTVSDIVLGEIYNTTADIPLESIWSGGGEFTLPEGTEVTAISITDDGQDVRVERSGGGVFELSPELLEKRSIRQSQQAQFSRPEVEDAYNAAKALIADGWDEESVADQMYTAYALNSNEVQEVLNALYEMGAKQAQTPEEDWNTLLTQLNQQGGVVEIVPGYNWVEMGTTGDVVEHHFEDDEGNDVVDEVRQGDDIVPELVRLTA